MAREPVQQFLASTTRALHDAVAEKGYASTGEIFVPELRKFGSRAVLGLLRKESLVQQFPDPNRYYCIMCGLCFAVGVLAAKDWHLDFDTFYSDDYLASIINTSTPPFVMAAPNCEKLFEMDSKQYWTFIMDLFLIWQERVEPYFQLPDSESRDYTFSSLLAVYLVGVSCTLERFGFGQD